VEQLIMATKTKFAGKTNPFTGEPTGQKRVNADEISITNDPLPERRVRDSKYDAMFATLKPGQSLRAPTKSIGSVAQGLRKWMQKNGQETVGRIKSVVKYEGDAGFGRIWLLAKEVKR
jgi:hypothetical protein